MNIVVVGVGNIGFSCARRLVPEHRLLLVDQRRPAYLETFLEAWPGVEFVEADARDPQAMQALFAGCFPGESLDLLFCTVGTRSQATAVADFGAFARDFETNVFGNLVPIQEALGRMLAAGSGKIAVVSSTSGHHAPSDLTAYAPSKWALESICGALRSELRDRGLAVDVLSATNLRNRHSPVFTTDFGLDPDRVAERVVRQLARAAGRAYFVPRTRRLIHPLERLAPGLLDLAAGLRPSRRRGFCGAPVRTALITGASSGLGRELARLYAPRLAELWLIARDGDALEALRAELASHTTCRVHIRSVDLADSEAVRALTSELGAIDLLINNAGGHVEGDVLATPLSSYRNAYAVHFLTPAWLVAELMARERPPSKLVNILSTTAIAGRRGLSAYGSAKAAHWTFTRSLRRVYGRSLQVLEVLPATFESSLFEKGARFEGSAGAAAPTRVPPAARLLSARRVAERIQAAESAGRERLFVPFEARLFLLLEALAPSLFRRLFP
jgi:short-subunit dehydrogenase